MHLLLVEDEPAIADFVARGLREEGHTVTHARDGVEGERRALSEDLDLAILDVMLPGKDGFAVLRAIQHGRPNLPVIMLTARDEVDDRIAGLDGGAIDYLTKPFAFEELAARVRAQLRRRVVEETVLRGAGLELDLLKRTVRRGEVEMSLSAREFDLLAYLLRNPDRVLSREQVLSAVWGYDHDPGTNIVEVYIGYLRRKLALPDAPAPIETVRSRGYRLRDA